MAWDRLSSTPEYASINSWLQVQFDSSTTTGRFFFHSVTSLMQMERDLTVERTQAVLEAARRQI